MAETILRPHKRRVDRWMPRTHSITKETLRTAAAYAVQCMPGFLLSLADLLGIPSGFHAAYGMAQAALSRDVRPTLLGSAAAMLLQLLSGVLPRWEMLITLAMMAFASLILSHRRTLWLMAATAASMLPTAIVTSLAPTAAEMLQGWAALAIAALSAPIMARALRCLPGERHLSAMEEKTAVGYLAALMICGGARILLPGMNFGVLLGACTTLSLALTLGAGPGAVAGMLSGVMLALQGLPLIVSISLAMGGFLCGVAGSLSRRTSCGAFALAAYLPLLLSGSPGGCGGAVLTAALLLGLLPRQPFEQLQAFLRRFLQNDPAPGDAYAAAALHAWEQTVAALARAVPSPRDGDAPRDGEWWQTRLCQGCPEYEHCGCLNSDLGVQKAEAAWSFRRARDEVWQGALEHLRGMGCQRLYFLLDAMNALRREDEAAQRITRQAEAQREMLVTHLTALSGAARRFAALSSGESWWDGMAARQIRQVLAEKAVPATLTFVRRVQGHIQAAFELQFITGARKQAEELCTLTAAVLDARMELASLDGDRVLLKERPLLHAEIGAAAEPITGGETCGDTAWWGSLQDGRCLIALSDGMGHGESAALSSRQTVELLRLCHDAGYSRRETLTAVNGMMLLGGDGERFATADVLAIDLWSGQATLDKLGAAASWLCQEGLLTRLTGDALPLGILEDIDLSGSDLRLRDGDALILLTDGVEDAFRSIGALENAILSALEAASPVQAAESLLAAALEADEGQRRDDQSAVFVYIRRS